MWRTEEDGRKVTLLATDAAFQALGIEVEPAPRAGTEAAGSAAKPKRARKAGGDKRQGARTSKDKRHSGSHSQPEKSATARQPRADTKQAQLIAMLSRPEGGSLDEIIAATGRQAHTVRGAIAGALKKKLGLAVSSTKVERRGRVYRIAEAGPA